MLKRLVAVGAGVLLVAGGVIAAGRWQDARVAACEQRGGQFAALDLFNRPPGGFQAEPTVAGCDTDRVVAYAIRQFRAPGGPGGDSLADRVVASVDRDAVAAFYRPYLRADGWSIVPRGALCATRDRATFSLSFPVAGSYETRVEDSSGCGTT
jgi:hypothetical protein